MKLKVIDQMHVSSVSSDTLRPGQVIEVSDAAGDDLVKHHPGKFELAGEKQKAAPANKKAATPANKSQAN